MVPYGTINVPYGTIWYHMPYGTIMVPYGTIWYFRYPKIYQDRSGRGLVFYPVKFSYFEEAQVFFLHNHIFHETDSSPFRVHMVCVVFLFNFWSPGVFGKVCKVIKTWVGRDAFGTPKVVRIFDL